MIMEEVNYYRTMKRTKQACSKKLVDDNPTKIEQNLNQINCHKLNCCVIHLGFIQMNGFQAQLVKR